VRLIGIDSPGISRKGAARISRRRTLGGLPFRGALKAIAPFDIGIIPFRNRAFTRGNSFLNLIDHFAHGTPMVATLNEASSGASNKC
jgi:hypothetical protein